MLQVLIEFFCLNRLINLFVVVSIVLSSLFFVTGSIFILQERSTTIRNFIENFNKIMYFVFSNRINVLVWYAS